MPSRENTIRKPPEKLYCVFSLEDQTTCNRELGKKGSKKYCMWHRVDGVKSDRELAYKNKKAGVVFVGEQLTCKNDKCENTFAQNNTKQVYCSRECQREQVNREKRDYVAEKRVERTEKYKEYRAKQQEGVKIIRESDFSTQVIQDPFQEIV